MDISLKKLNYLVTLAETQSFTRAAELLHLSQPALSKTISAIEETYGVRLFDRSRSGVHVTTVGAEIIADAKRLLRQARSFDHNSRVLAGGKRGRVSLGIGPTAATLVLPQLAGGILDHGSGIILNTEIRPLHVLISLLNSEKIEFFIAESTFTEIPPEIEYQQISSTQAAFFVRDGHPLLGAETVLFEEVLDYTIACQEEPSPFFEYRPNLSILSCENYGILRRTALSSDVICILPRQLDRISREMRLNRLPIEDWTPRNIPIIAGWVRGRTLSPLAGQIVETARALFADIDETQSRQER